MPIIPMLLRGEDVTLDLPDGTSKQVGNVLVAQTDLSDQTIMDVQTRFINQARYKGDQDTLTLEWPKDCPDSLIGAYVTVRGERFRVYGNPIAYAAGACPTSWDRQVVVTRALFLYDVDLLEESATQDEWGVWHVEYQPRPIKANLLRQADDGENSAGQKEAMQPIVMFEIRQEDYQGELHLRYQGEVYEVTARAWSTDTVVVTSTGRIAHEGDDGVGG